MATELKAVFARPKNCSFQSSVLSGAGDCLAHKSKQHPPVIPAQVVDNEEMSEEAGGHDNDGDRSLSPT